MSAVEGPAVHSTSTQLNRKTRLFIRSEAEGSAVLLISSKDPLPIRLFIMSGAQDDDFVVSWKETEFFCIL